MLEAKISVIRDNTIDIIHSLSKVNHVFISLEDYNKLVDDEDLSYGNYKTWDDLLELPYFSYVNKHGYYDEYRIINIQHGRVYGVGWTEGVDGEPYDISLNEMSTDELVNLAKSI